MSAVLSMETSPASIARIRRLISDVRTNFVQQLGVSGSTETLALAYELEEALKAEFKAGGHDKSGGVDEEVLGRKATIKDMEVHRTAFGAMCSMGGAALLVNDGSKPHPIDVHPETDPPYLHFKGSRGWAMVEHVDHPGYKGDPFALRALEDLDLGLFAARILAGAYARITFR